MANTMNRLRSYTSPSFPKEQTVEPFLDAPRLFEDRNLSNLTKEALLVFPKMNGICVADRSDPPKLADVIGKEPSTKDSFAAGW